jgi:hypothetical protein
MYTIITSEVQRNTQEVSESITYIFNTYSEATLVTRTVLDQNEDTIEYQDFEYSEENLIGTRTATYIIPEADQTTAAHGTAHPHDHEIEIEYQEKSTKWWNDFCQTQTYMDIVQELNM